MKKHSLFTGARRFTLIELLIVIAIIAILALIALPNFLDAQTNGTISSGDIFRVSKQGNPISMYPRLMTE